MSNVCGSLFKEILSLVSSIKDNPDYLQRITNQDSDFVSETWKTFIKLYQVLASEAVQKSLNAVDIDELVKRNAIGDEEIWCLLEEICNHPTELDLAELTPSKKDYLVLPIEIIDGKKHEDKVDDNELSDEDSEEECMTHEDKPDDNELWNEGTEEEAIVEDGSSEEDSDNESLPNLNGNSKEIEKLNSKRKDVDDSNLDLSSVYFAEEDSDLEAGRMKYDDFYNDGEQENCDTSEKISNQGSEEELEEDVLPSADSESEDDQVENQKSSFQLKQERMKQKIAQLEQNSLGEKHWPLRGEIVAAQRPVNSLLEEVVEIETSSRPAPVITEEVTLKFEDIIKSRIKQKLFDDVQKKIKPVQSPNELKKKITLDQEKSKFSLAEVYEKEYLKQTQEQGKEVQEEVVENLAEKQEIHKSMTELFRKIDTLCNYHFVPRPAAPEIKIVSNLPALASEEVTPTGTSNVNLLAPEEIAGNSRRKLSCKEELTKTDKKRALRKKKKLQGIRAKIASRNQPALSNMIKSKKETITKSGKTLKSSKEFFSRLQESEDASVSTVAKKRRKI